MMAARVLIAAGHYSLYKISYNKSEMKYSLKNWYVIQTIVKKEKSIKEKIEKLTIEKLQTLLPLRKLCIRRKGNLLWELKSLFPGYFFINKELEPIDIKKITRLNGVVKILPNFKNPVTVPEDDMKLILSLMDNNEEIPESQIFYENDRVVVKAGPLMNMEGRIISVEKRKKRITIRLPFFNTYKDVQFSFELITKAK